MAKNALRFLPGFVTVLLVFTPQASEMPPVQSKSTTTMLSPLPATGFLVASSYPAGLGPVSIAVGDANGDGIQDLAVANSIGNSVSLLLGRGDGTFTTHVDYATGKGPSSVAFADVDGDGNLDLILSNSADGTVSILKGNGDGTFQAHVDFAAGMSPTSVVVADFNGDNHPDIAVVNPPAGTISLLLGNGNGSFKAAVSYPVANPVSAAAADLNGDGRADLVVANNANPGQPGPSNPGGSLTVFLGKGDGSFQPGIVYSLNLLGPLSVTIADLNGDGKLDLISPTTDQVTIPGPGSVTILLGNGDGSFNSPLTYTTDRATEFSTAYAIAGDFDGDGHMDVAITSSSDNTLSVLLGNGDGTFRSQVNFGTGSSPSFVASGDFNGDGVIDLVTPNSSDNDVSVLLGNGIGTFQARVDYGVGFNPSAVATGDFNSDKKVDIITADIFEGVSLLLGNGDGTFRQRVSSAIASQSFGIVAADFNGDNKLDVATANVGGPAVSVLLGNGDGTFQPPIYYAVPNGPQLYGAHPMVAADFNGDGAPDLVVAGGGHVSLLLNNRNGTFQPAIDLGFIAQSVGSADFNGDGKADLVIAGTQIAVLLGNGDGTFKAPIYIAGSARDLAVGDFDGNGKTDLVVVRAGAFSVLLGKGDGTFLPAVDYPASFPESIAVGDLNGDGHTDIVVATGSLNTLQTFVPRISVFLNNGDGTFQAGIDYAGGSGGLVIADFNGDGKLDISGTNPVGSADPFFRDGLVSVLLNGQFPIVGVLSSKNPSLPGAPVSFTTNVTATGSAATLPTGTVVLQDGSVALGSATLNGGAVTFPSVSLSTGTHQIIARYGGDNNFRPGSAGLRQIVAVPDFSVVVSKLTPASVMAGQSATATLTLAAVGGFSGLIGLSCSVSPMPARAPSCAMSPGSIQLGNGASPQSTLTVSTIAPSAAFAPRRLGTSALWSFALFICFSTIVHVGRRRKLASRVCLRGLFLAEILVFAAALQVGCGGANQHNATVGTPHGNYTITIQAVSGGVQHTTTSILTVN